MTRTDTGARRLTQDVGALGIRSTQVRGFGDWKDFVHDHFPWLEHRDRGGAEFHAEVSSHRFTTGSLSTINAGASEVIRTRQLAQAAETGYIKLLWQRAGSLEIEQDSRQSVIEVGQATVCDTTRPYRIRLSEGASFAVLMLPHDACPGWDRISQKICGTRFGDGAGMRAALAALMALTSGTRNASEDDTVMRAVQWMLTSSLHQLATESGAACGVSNNRLHKAQQHIIENIGNPGLDANDLAAALCISRRSLYTLFREYRITPGRMIHDMRLEQSLQVLRDPANHARKITDIAYDHGFNDYATFSRLFKAQYGMTPSEYRLRARAPREEE